MVTPNNSYDVRLLKSLQRERELMYQRYQSLLVHPNPMRATDALATVTAVDVMLDSVRERMAKYLEETEG